MIPDLLLHGVGARTPLPLPLWQMSWAAIAALGFSFVGLGFLWTTPKGVVAPPETSNQDARDLERQIYRYGWPVTTGLGAAFMTLCFAAGLVGVDAPIQNLTPVTVYVMFWVVVPIAVLLVGNFWKQISPFEFLGWLTERAGLAGRGGKTLDHQWIAAAVLFGFLFLELAHPSGDSPLVLAWAIATYSVVTVIGVIVYGRSWIHHGEGFGVLFRMIGVFSSLRWSRRGPRLVNPLRGISEIVVVPGTVLVIMTVLGGTSFDGFSESEDFGSLVGSTTGWSLASPTVIGLWVAILFGFGLFLAAAKFAANVGGISWNEAANMFAPSLLPIVWGYIVAHYALLVVDETQRFVILLSNPFGRFDGEGAPTVNLFGTADGTVNFDLVSLDVMAWVQTIAIVGGHIGGVVVAHEIGLQKFDHKRAIQSQYAMLFVMMIFSVGGLILLFNS